VRLASKALRFAGDRRIGHARMPPETFDGPSSAAPEVWYSGFRAATLSAFKRIADGSFYRLVGTVEQCGRDGNAESLCGLEVDEQVNFRGLLDR